ncbi:hypothetical protein V2G26_003471 [Clonostachys chloroleuca]
MRDKVTLPITFLRFTAFRHTLEASSHRSYSVRQTQLPYHTNETRRMQRLHVTRNMTIPPQGAEPVPDGSPQNTSKDITTA